MRAPASQSPNLDLLDRELHSAPVITAPISQGGRKRHLRAGPLLRQMAKTIALDRLIGADAWADAAITLVAFEHRTGIPAVLSTKMMNCCALCRDNRNFPSSSMNLRRGGHAMLAPAVLRAFVAARCMSGATQQVTALVHRFGRTLPSCFLLRQPRLRCSLFATYFLSLKARSTVLRSP